MTTTEAQEQPTILLESKGLCFSLATPDNERFCEFRELARVVCDKSLDSIKENFPAYLEANREAPGTGDPIIEHLAIAAGALNAVALFHQMQAHINLNDNTPKGVAIFAHDEGLINSVIMMLGEIAARI